MIEFRHLRYFIAVSEELSFSRAAERVHVDQSALSRAIRDLENQLGVQLFLRLSRRLQLTPAGLKLAKEAGKLVFRFERMKLNVSHTGSMYKTPLRVCVADGIAHVSLAECIRRWQTANPEVPVDLTDMRARDCVEALKSEEVDLGISYGVYDDEFVVSVAAWRSPVVAVLPRGHELSERPALSMSDLIAFPLLSWNEERTPGLVAQMRAILRRYGDRATFAGEACTLSGYLTRVAIGAGVGLADGNQTEFIQRDDVVILPLEEHENFTIFMVHKRRRMGLGDSLTRFLSHVSKS